MGESGGDEEINKKQRVVSVFHKHMCRAATSAARCYQKINPPMEHLKWEQCRNCSLQLSKITSPFRKSNTAELLVTESGAAAGRQVKGLLCTNTNRDGRGLLMKAFQKAWSGYMRLHFVRGVKKLSYIWDTKIKFKAFSLLSILTSCFKTWGFFNAHHDMISY